MFSAESESDLVNCPYNLAHCRKRSRLQQHHLKCCRNYPDAELKKCPFYITQHVPEQEFYLHITNCSDRKLITQYQYDAPAPKNEEVVKHASFEWDENWDDTEVEDYNPLKYLEKKNVLIQPVGMSSAQRKAYRKKERRRLGNGSSNSEEEKDQVDDDYSESEKLILQNEEFDIKKAVREAEPQKPPPYSEYDKRVQADELFTIRSHKRRSSPPRNISSGRYNSDDDQSTRHNSNRNSGGNRRSGYNDGIHYEYDGANHYVPRYQSGSQRHGRAEHRGTPNQRRRN